MTHTPPHTTPLLDRERILKWMRNTSTDKLEAQLASAIRVGNSPRAALLQETLERRARRLYERRLAALPPSQRPRPTPRVCLPWRPIVEDVCARHGVSLGEVVGGCRALPIKKARHELWWRLSRRGVSYAEIGRRLGGFDHTTVRHGVLKFGEMVGQ